MKLSAHFTLEEMTDSLTAERIGIDNNPPDEFLPTLKFTARKLELLRQRVGCPIYVLSGYRSLRLNNEVGGEPDSQHLYGEAVDMVSPDLGSNALLAMFALDMIDELDFDQMILEGSWVHISFVSERNPRNEVLTMIDARYERGLVVSSSHELS